MSRRVFCQYVLAETALLLLPDLSSKPARVSRSNDSHPLVTALKKRILQEQGWKFSYFKPFQFTEWLPLFQSVADEFGLHTMQEPGGSAAVCDFLSGNSTYQQHALDLEAEYLNHKSERVIPIDRLKPIYRLTTGYCAFVNAAATVGEPAPYDYIGLGAYAIKYSKAELYIPADGKEGLMEDLAEKGLPFEMENQTNEKGFESRVVHGVSPDRKEVMVTNFKRGDLIIPVDSIQRAYRPVHSSKRSDYPSNMLYPAAGPDMLELWGFSPDPDQEIIDRMVQGRYRI